MLQVLIGHGTGEGSSVTVRRDGDDVRISTSLGPDSSPTAGTERAWLSRMALRYGGRHELEGGNETLVLPAEGSADRTEREALRKELDEARKQGEVYARELAAVFDRGEEVATVSSVPPAPGPPAADRFATITKVCAGVASELRAIARPAHDGARRRCAVTRSPTSSSTRSAVASATRRSSSRASAASAACPRTSSPPRSISSRSRRAPRATATCSASATR